MLHLLLLLFLLRLLFVIMTRGDTSGGGADDPMVNRMAGDAARDRPTNAALRLGTGRRERGDAANGQNRANLFQFHEFALFQRPREIARHPNIGTAPAAAPEGRGKIARRQACSAPA